MTPDPYADLRAALEAALAIENPSIPNGNTERVFRELEAAANPATIAALLAEVDAWQERFPQYRYRPQDDCVALQEVGK